MATLEVSDDELKEIMERRATGDSRTNEEMGLDYQQTRQMDEALKRALTREKRKTAEEIEDAAAMRRVQSLIADINRVCKIASSDDPDDENDSKSEEAAKAYDVKRELDNALSAILRTSGGGIG